MNRRISSHPILEFQADEIIEFYFNGIPLKAKRGDTIASALIANGYDIFGFTSSGNPRGFFCAIGKCSACLVEVNGIPNVRACITPVQEGMVVKSQYGRGKAKW